MTGWVGNRMPKITPRKCSIDSAVYKAGSPRSSSPQSLKDSGKGKERGREPHCTAVVIRFRKLGTGVAPMLLGFSPDSLCGLRPPLCGLRPCWSLEVGGQDCPSHPPPPPSTPRPHPRACAGNFVFERLLLYLVRSCRRAPGTGPWT